ncbi:MAG TPA: pitrilysin family protein [Bacteroidota bacterium]
MKSAGKLGSPSPSKLQSTYKKTILPDGVRVISEEIPHVRSVSVGIWVDVGSRDESEQNNGIAHFIEHMAFKGTKRRSVRDIAQSLESVGGYLNAFTGKEHTCFYARVLDEFTPLAIDVLADIVQNATFPEKEIEKEKGVVIEELKNAEDDPDDIIHDYFEKSIFGSHPLGFPVIGNEKNLRSFRRNDLTKYLKHGYVPSKTIVAAAGNVDHKSIVELVKRSYRDQVVINGISGTRTRPTAQKAKHNEYRKPIQQAHVCLGTVGYSMNHKQRYALMVLNSLLGDGMSSRLFQNIREKYGFAYNVYSFANMMSDTGTFGAYIGTDTRHIEDSISLIWKEFRKILDRGVTKAELERTKAQLKGGMMLGLESIPNRMMRLGSSELYFGEFNTMDSIMHHVEAVTVDAVNEVANDVLKKEQYSSVVFKPEET